MAEVRTFITSTFGWWGHRCGRQTAMRIKTLSLKSDASNSYAKVRRWNPLDRNLRPIFVVGRSMIGRSRGSWLSNILAVAVSIGDHSASCSLQPHPGCCCRLAAVCQYYHAVVLTYGQPIQMVAYPRVSAPALPSTFDTFSPTEYAATTP